MMPRQCRTYPDESCVFGPCYFGGDCHRKAQQPEPRRPTLSEAQVRAIEQHINGWKSATFGWQDDPDPAVAERNKITAIEAHAAECIRRIRVTLGVRGGAPRKPTNAEVAEWAERHDLRGGATDLRCAFEDAQTLHMTDGVGAAPATGGGWEPDAWAAYIAGMLVSYLSSENAAREVDQREAAIAGIIRRRIHWLIPARGVALPRVPLTLDRIDELWEALEHKAPVYLARAVEREHGISNAGVNLPDGAQR